jgi:4-amino-4-deoxy-L-arabinose transferase-like glycosyltransferase
MGILDNKQERLAYLSFILIAFIGACAITYSTRWGAVVYSDATEYILSARNLLGGNGLGIPGPGGSFLPLTLHPPLYPLVLSGLGVFGLDPFEGARWLNVLLFGAIIFLVSGALFYFSKRFSLSLLIGVVILTAPLFLDIFSRAMAEALFFFFGFLSLFLLAKFLKSPQRKWIVAAGITAGLACLTRYTGAVLVISGVLILLISPRRTSWKNRAIDLAIFAGLAGGLAMAWLLPLFLRTQQIGARSFQVDDHLSIALREARVSLIDLGWSWIPFSQSIDPLPSYFIRGWFMIALFGLLISITVLIAWRRYISSGKKFNNSGLLMIAGVFALFAAIYLGFISVSFFFSSPRNDLDGRLLSPVYLAGLLVFFPLLAWDFESTSSKRWLGLVPIVGLLILAVGGVEKSLNFIQNNHEIGSGYTSQAWMNSPTIQVIKDLNPDRALISNESAAILFLTGRPAYDVNVIDHDDPSEIDIRYGEDLEDPAQRLFKANQAVLVIFPTSFYWQLFAIYGDRTQARLDHLLEGLQIEQSLSDGVIYRYPTP